MERNILTTSALRVALDDAERFRKESPWWFWGGEVGCGGGNGGLGAALGTYCTPASAERTMSVLYPAIGGFIGLLLGALGFFILYIFKLLRAPYRKLNAAIVERNEAVAALKAIPGATANSPRIAAVQVYLNNPGYEFGLPDNPFKVHNLPENTQLLQVTADCQVAGMTTIERIRLKMAGESLDGLTWTPCPMDNQGTLLLHEYFQVPKILSPGSYSAQLETYAEGIWWATPAFSITIPSSDPGT